MKSLMMAFSLICAAPVATAQDGLQNGTLIGPEWVVESMAGRPIIDSSRMTLVFGTEGRVEGRAGCNPYTSSFAQGEADLRFGLLLSRSADCGPALMQQESRFLAALAEVTGFSIDPTGALTLLRADDSVAVTARRD